MVLFAVARDFWDRALSLVRTRGEERAIGERLCEITELQDFTEYHLLYDCPPLPPPELDDAVTEPLPIPTVADLKPRQLAVASLISRCYTDKHIAAELGVSDRMVRVYIESLVFLLGLDRSKDLRMQIGQWWWEETQRPRAQADGDTGLPNSEHDDA